MMNSIQTHAHSEKPGNRRPYPDAVQPQGCIKLATPGDPVPERRL
jgi:hypothetical protein